MKRNLSLVRAAVAALCVAFGPMHSALARCLDDEGLEMRNGAASTAPATPADALEPRVRLQNMVRDALRMSQAVGAAQLLAEAAESDTDATRAARLPTLAFNGTLGHIGNGYDGGSDSGFHARAGLSVNQLLFDSGRNTQLTSWRVQLAEAAKQGQIGTQEQVALLTVSLALERSRYRLQTQIYGQYQRKMVCLVEALETIVRADRGRASELVQAKKTQQQAELARLATQSLLAQVETRLKRLVGDTLPSPDGMASILLAPPALNDILVEAERSSDIIRLEAQANAAESLARSIDAEGKTSANLTFGGSKAVGVGSPSSWSAGVAINVPLLSPAVAPAGNAARKRAEAARLQRADALESRRYRMVEVHEQATSSFDRARRSVEVVRDSDQVRGFTLQQWQQLGKRSLFDVMSAESEYYALRVAYVNALHDGQQSTALLRSLGQGIAIWLQ